MKGGQGQLGIDPGGQKLLAEDWELLELELEDDCDPDPEPDVELEDDDRRPDEELATGDELDEEGGGPIEELETDDELEDDSEPETDDELCEEDELEEDELCEEDELEEDEPDEGELDEDECDPEGELELGDGTLEEEDEPDDACELDDDPDAELDDGCALEEEIGDTEEEIGEMEEGMTAIDPSGARHEAASGEEDPPNIRKLDYLTNLVKEKIRESHKMLCRSSSILARPVTPLLSIAIPIPGGLDSGGERRFPRLVPLWEDDRRWHRPQISL